MRRCAFFCAWCSRIWLRLAPARPKADPAHLHVGAVAFIHRLGSSLNTHVHFHVCVVDGVFEALPDAKSDAQAPEPAGSVNAPSITFHPAQINDTAIRHGPGLPLWQGPYGAYPLGTCATSKK